MNEIREAVEVPIRCVGFILGKILYYPIFICALLSRALIAGYYSSLFYKNPTKKVIIGSNCFIRGSQYIELQSDVIIGNNVILTAWDHYRKQQKFNPKISIGKSTKIGDYCNISAINNVTIGKNVLLGRFITIIDHSHGKSTIQQISTPPWDRNLYSKGGVNIGDNVWIGDKATILPNVEIGDNCVIGANSLVTKSYPANCVIAGNPAKIIRKINDSH